MDITSEIIASDLVYILNEYKGELGSFTAINQMYVKNNPKVDNLPLCLYSVEWKGTTTKRKGKTSIEYDRYLVIISFVSLVELYDIGFNHQTNITNSTLDINESLIKFIRHKLVNKLTPVNYNVNNASRPYQKNGDIDGSILDGRMDRTKYLEYWQKQGKNVKMINGKFEIIAAVKDLDCKNC